jgi:hypothetical protein
MSYSYLIHHNLSIFSIFWVILLLLSDYPILIPYYFLLIEHSYGKCSTEIDDKHKHDDDPIRSKHGCWWFGTFLFFHILRISSSQRSPSFFRGVGRSTTDQKPLKFPLDPKKNTP